MTTLSENLSLLGLSESAQRVFEYLLQQGKASATEISVGLSIKRPTVYLYLAELKEKELIVEEEINKKSYFKSINLTSLKHIIRSKVSELKSLENTISDIYKSFPKSSSQKGIEIYHGEKGALSLANEIASFAGEVYYLGSLAGVSHFVGEKYYETLYNKLRRKKMGMDYMISDYTKMTVKYFYKESGMFTKRRWLPSEIKVDGIFILFGNKLVIAKYQPKLIVQVVEDKGLATIFKLAYQSLWISLEGKNIPPKPKP